jgi:hypothetical protein
VLRKIYGPKRDTVIEQFRILHNEELHNLYSSPDIFRTMNSRTHRLSMWIRGRTQGMNTELGKPLGKLIRRWEYNIRRILG